MSFKVYFTSILLAILLPQMVLVVLGSAVRDAVVFDNPTWYLFDPFLLLTSIGLISFWGGEMRVA